jgi:hypothetical protein
MTWWGNIILTCLQPLQKCIHIIIISCSQLYHKAFSSVGNNRRIRDYAFSADNASFGAGDLLLSLTWHHDTVLEQLYRCSVCDPANENWMSKHASLAQHFFARFLLRLVRGSTQQSWTLAREKCNKYDLTAIPCFWLANHMDCSRWLSMNCLLSIEVPVSVWWAGIGNESK